MAGGSKSLDKITISIAGVDPVTIRNFTDDGIAFDFPNQNAITEDSQGLHIWEINPNIDRCDLTINMAVTMKQFTKLDRIYRVWHESAGTLPLAITGRRGGADGYTRESIDGGFMNPPRDTGIGTNDTPTINLGLAARNFQRSESFGETLINAIT